MVKDLEACLEVQITSDWKAWGLDHETGHYLARCSARHLARRSGRRLRFHPRVVHDPADVFCVDDSDQGWRPLLALVAAKMDRVVRVVHAAVLVHAVLSVDPADEAVVVREVLAPLARDAVREALAVGAERAAIDSRVELELTFRPEFP